MVINSEREVLVAANTRLFVRRLKMHRFFAIVRNARHRKMSLFFPDAFPSKCKSRTPMRPPSLGLEIIAIGHRIQEFDLWYPAGRKGSPRQV
jgi:hypothetical protein